MTRVLLAARRSTSGDEPVDPGTPDGPLRQVADLTAVSLGQGTQGTAQTWRAMHKLRATGTGLQLFYTAQVGWASLSSTVRVAVDVAGTVHPVTFDGQREMVLTPGSQHLSDPIDITVPAGRTIGVRTYVPAGFLLSSLGGLKRVSDGDLTTAGSPPVTDHPGLGASVPGPLGILGRVAPTQIAVGLVGDSIGNQGHTPDITIDAGGGWFVQAARAANLPSIGLAVPMARFGVDDRYGDHALESLTHVLSQFGVTSLRNLPELVQTQTAAIAYWRWAQARCPRLWQTTCTPYPDTTDSCTTLAGQTTTPNEAKRAAWNAWLRDGAPIKPDDSPASVGASPARPRAGHPNHPLTGIVDTAAAVEHPTETGKWRVDTGSLSYDGTHLTSAGQNTYAVPATAWALSLTL